MEELYKWSKNGMKMIINSDFKKFNNETNDISTGNVLSNTQYSNYIRPYEEEKCNGQVFEKGHLQKYDLQFFDLTNANEIKDYIKNTNHGITLYQFFTHDKNGDRDIIGWFIEDNKKIVMQQVNYRHGKNYFKRVNALNYAKKIIEQHIEKYGF